ncbi:MAG: hypothetical protein AAFU85_22800 [Planctomycetota bacterium]
MMLMRYLPRFQAARRSLPCLATRETWDRERISAFQLDRLNRVWESSIESVPYYRRLKSEHRLPRQFETLEHFSDVVPTLAKGVVRSAPQEFLSSGRRVGSWHLTGGSTGVPMAVYWESDAHREMLQCKYRYEQKFGVDFFDKKVFLWGHSASFAPGVKGWIKRRTQPTVDRLRNRLRRSAYQLGRKQLAEHLKAIAAFKPASIYGYSSAVHLLATEAERLGFELPSLRLVTMTAEPADASMRAFASASLKAPSGIEYGSVECGIMAFTDPDGRTRLREDVTYLETLPRDDGRYEIVVTVLNNHSFPLIRYRIEDLTDRPINRQCDGFARLGEIEGRNNDFLLTRSGKPLHAIVLKHLFEADPRIRRFQAKQASDGSLEILLESEHHGIIDAYETSRTRIANLLEGYSVRLSRTDQIQGNLAGKHRWIVSDLGVAPQIANRPETDRAKNM